MKHILIFEAFSSIAIVKTLSYLSNNIKDGKKAKDKFIEGLRGIKEILDIPIDKITDNDLSYLSKQDALLIKNSTTVENNRGIYCLKFWFSIEKGYLGYTYTGNKIIKSDTTTRRIDQSGRSLTKDEIAFLGIRTGIITTLKDVRDLKTGDQIIGYFQDELDTNHLAIATFFRDKGGRSYAIQNVSSGGSPEDTRRSEWSKYGEYSWNIGVNDIGSDSKKLSLYIPNDKLIINGIETEIEDDPIESQEVNEYNLPMRHESATSWSNRSDLSITKDNFDKADFSIVLYYDDLIKNQMELPSQKITRRELSRKGAIALLSSDDIKEENIRRYMGAALRNMGVTEATTDIRNVEKVITRILLNDFAIFSIYHGGVVDNRIIKVFTKVKEIAEYQKEYEKTKDNDYPRAIRDKYDTTIDLINGHREDYLNCYKTYKLIIEKLIKNGYVDNAAVLQRILDIGKLLTDKINKTPINNLKDMRLMYFKLRSIRDVLGDTESGIGSSIKNSFDNLRYGINDPDAYDYIRGIDIEDVNERLDGIEKYIDSTL